ncbi:hypothetical protein BC628DRAFT_238151 [Trametes gibbosa]|nr:hypothetical protein BC628DRAFT_238151 [Trametes gibbosa]
MYAFTATLLAVLPNVVVSDTFASPISHVRGWKSPRQPYHVAVAEHNRAGADALQPSPHFTESIASHYSHPSSRCEPFGVYTPSPPAAIQTSYRNSRSRKLRLRPITALAPHPAHLHMSRISTSRLGTGDLLDGLGRMVGDPSLDQGARPPWTIYPLTLKRTIVQLNQPTLPDNSGASPGKNFLFTCPPGRNKLGLTDTMSTLCRGSGLRLRSTCCKTTIRCATSAGISSCSALLCGHRDGSCGTRSCGRPRHERHAPR